MARSKLGRGLGSLLADDEPAAAGAELLNLKLDDIEANPYQPRSDFEEESLASLTESIKARGVLEPILVRQVSEGYQIVAGERRWRASIQAGLETIPARVMQVEDADMLELALVENIQREDLNPIEKAQAFKAYLDTYEVSQQELAKRVGLDRATVANMIRLLDLSEDVQVAIRGGLLTMGHGRALLAITDAAEQGAVCTRVVEEGLSVRETERLAAAQGRAANAPAKGPTKTAHVRDIENQLTTRLGQKVRISVGNRKGTGAISIRFESNSEFERLVEWLSRPTQ